MGTKYTTNSDTGYNSSPPPDDGTTGDDNKVAWSKHKTKLTDPIRTNVTGIDADLVAHFDVDTKAKTGAYTTLADDDRRVIECTSSPTITLGAASSMGTGYEVTVKCVSGTTTVATSDTIDASASNRSLAAAEVETYVVNAAADGYVVAGRDRTKFDTISEETAANGVAIDGLTIKDSGFELGSDAEGDIYYVDSVLALRRLGIGTAGQMLRTNAGATAPEWTSQAIFTEHYESSSPTSLTGANTAYTEAHGLSGIPKLYTVSLRCTDAGGDAGYSQNDEIDMSATSASTNDKSIFADATNVGISGSNNITNWLVLTAVKAGGSGGLTATKWGWVVRAWY